MKRGRAKGTRVRWLENIKRKKEINDKEKDENK